MRNMPPRNRAGNATSKQAEAAQEQEHVFEGFGVQKNDADLTLEEWIEMPREVLTLKCNQLRLVPSGSKTSLANRLFAYFAPGHASTTMTRPAPHDRWRKTFLKSDTNVTTSTSTKSTPICFSCQQPGHIAPNCPLKKESACPDFPGLQHQIHPLHPSQIFASNIKPLPLVPQCHQNLSSQFVEISIAQVSALQDVPLLPIIATAKVATGAHPGRFCPFVYASTTNCPAYRN